MRSRQPAGCRTEQVPTRTHRPISVRRLLDWHLVAWFLASGLRWARTRSRTLTHSWQSALARHPALRFAQIIPVGLLLWALDDAASFRAGAAAAGLRHAVTVNAVSTDVGGAFGLVMNDWLAVHHLPALAATWYYILVQGALTGVVGALLIWRRVPSFALHRNALIAVTALGLLAFWIYPVAPPRLLPGYHDIVASVLPAFSATVEPNGSATYASLPSLHVAWALWVAIAGAALVRRAALRALLWLYPAVTITDVMATANHYWLDAITAVGLVLLGYGIALSADRARTHLAVRHAAATRGGYGGPSLRATVPHGAVPHHAVPHHTVSHGAVLACALPSADSDGRRGDDTTPRR